VSAAGIRVVLTGAAGYLGTMLARRCVENEAEVLGIDIRPPGPHWPAQATFAIHDVTDSSLTVRLSDFAPDVLVHLAWIFDPVHDQQYEACVDVDGTRNAFEAAAASGVRRIVYPSSTTSYGIDINRSSPLLESDPPLPNPAYPYGRFKAEVEQWLPGFREANPSIDVVVARTCIVIGAHASNIVTHITGWPVMFRIAGANPPMQFMHEADAVDMMWWAITEAPAGTFNAAGSGVVSYKEICRMAGRPCIVLPAAMLYALVELGWRFRLLRFPAGLLDYIRYSWVADTARMTEELGFRPRFSSRDALQAYLQGSRAQRYQEMPKSIR
jgi:UDP-glucose 4-epimerase